MSQSGTQLKDMHIIDTGQAIVCANKPGNAYDMQSPVWRAVKTFHAEILALKQLRIGHLNPAFLGKKRIIVFIYANTFGVILCTELDKPFLSAIMSEDFRPGATRRASSILELLDPFSRIIIAAKNLFGFQCQFLEIRIRLL